jgi:hypothetical protein
VLRALPDVGAKPLRQPVTTTAQALPAAAARARIDAALAQARRQADGQRAAARAQAAQAAQAAQSAQAAKVRQVQDAKAAGMQDPRGLASTGESPVDEPVYTVGGTNGTAASVSCPWPAASATVTGGGSATPTLFVGHLLRPIEASVPPTAWAALTGVRVGPRRLGGVATPVITPPAHLPGAMPARHWVAIEIDADAAG